VAALGKYFTLSRRMDSVTGSASDSRLSLADDHQKAMMVWTIGTQPFMPAVYGVNAPV